MTRSTTRVTKPWTCGLTRVEHEVTDADFAAYYDHETNCLLAVCGEYLVPQPGGLPNGEPCHPCRRVLNATVEHVAPPPRKIDVAELYLRPDVVIPRQDRRSHRRHSAWYRLVRRSTSEVTVAEVLAAADPGGPAPADVSPRAQATPDGTAGAGPAAA